MSTIHGISTDGTNNYRLQETNASHVDIGIGTDLETYVASQKINLLTQYDNALYSVGRGSQAVVDALDNGDILMALTTEESADFRAGMNNMSELTHVCRNLLDIWRNDGPGSTSTSWDVLKAELQAWTNIQLENYLPKSLPHVTTGDFHMDAGNIILYGVNPYDGINTVGDRIIMYKSGKNNSGNASILGSLIFSANTGQGGCIYLRVYNGDSNTTIGDAVMHGLPIAVEGIDYPYFSVPTIPVAKKDFLPSKNQAINVSYLETIGNGVVHTTGNEAIPGYKRFTGNPQFQINDSSAPDNTTIPLTIHNKKSIYDYAGDNTVFVIPVFAHTNDAPLNIGGWKASFDAVNKIDVNELYTTQNGKQGRLGVTYYYDSNVDVVEGYCTGRFAVNGRLVTNTEAPLGTASNKWSEVYATNGTIQTSDERAKTEITDIPEAVFRAWGRVKFQQFKMKESVKKKDSANARIHFGIIAQRIKEEFDKENIDPTRYGLYCYDRWDTQYEDIEVVDVPEHIEEVKVVDKSKEIGARTVIDSPAVFDNNGNVIKNEVSHEETYELAPEVFHMEKVTVPVKTHTERRVKKAAGELYSVRYEECFALECAYQRWRLDQLESRLNG